MKYLRLFEDFNDYDPYELMIISPQKKAQMLIEEIQKEGAANLDFVNDLIQLGADLDWQDEEGSTALHICAGNNHLKIARMLIDAGADVNIQDEYGWTALHWCARFNSLRLARMLIEAGADVDIQTEKGWTALHWCGLRNHPEIARMLIDAGADKTIQDDDGKLPYELAETEELKELLQP